MHSPLSRGRPVGDRRSVPGLREVREARGLSRDALASKLPCCPDPSTIALWESGKNAPSFEIVGELCKALKCTRSMLYGAKR